MHSDNLSDLLFFVWYEYLHIFSLALLRLTGFGGRNIPLYTSKPNSDLIEQLIRSTFSFLSPQLEANTIIPARQYAVSVRVEPPPCRKLRG